MWAPKYKMTILLEMTNSFDEMSVIYGDSLPK
jgi:hypothetical protein